VGLRREINSHDIRTKTTLMAVAELADHFRQRELLDSNMRITYSTKKAYASYLTKWFVPRWGQNALQHIKAREVELWLASVQRARTTRAKIRNVMSLLFNHARRYDLFDGNPIQWVRQSAKRRSAPNVTYDWRGTAFIGSATAARKNPGVLGRKHRTATE
jgi:hypothetical protein